MTSQRLDRRFLLRVAALSPALAAEAASGVSHAQTAGPLVVVAEITAKPDQADAFRALFLIFAASVRTEPGCLHYTVLEDERTPGRFFTYESWTDRADLAAHMRAPAIMALGAKGGDMLAKPPTETVLKMLSAS
jgi:autoinducer 2-degrading protein